jgi:very-short-patch-repair endonuclease
VRLHRSRNLTPEFTTRRSGIQVTTTARTVADLRRVVSPEQVRRAVREADVLGLDIDAAAEGEPTRSELEHRFLLCRRHRLTMPEPNAAVPPFTADFLWREPALIIETDGYRYHRGPAGVRGRPCSGCRAATDGYEVVRFTYRQVVDDPAKVAATLRALLTRGVPSSPTGGGQAR